MSIEPCERPPVSIPRMHTHHHGRRWIGAVPRNSEGVDVGVFVWIFTSPVRDKHERQVNAPEHSILRTYCRTLQLVPHVAEVVAENTGAA
jgi:hypothetical protein